MSLSNRHQNNRKPSALAVRVAAERRQRAILAMLKDEQSELTEQLDERFRELSQQGVVATKMARKVSENGGTKQIITATTTTAGEEKSDGGKREDGGDEDDRQPKTTPTMETDYDQLYYDLQLLPPAINPTADESKTPAQSSKDADPPLDFGTELDAFLECASADAASSSANVAKLDALFRTRLQPALEKCSVSGPRHILDKLGEFHADFLHTKNDRMASYPTFVQVTFLQLAAKLFPSDARFHPILTPTVAFASELIAHTRICSVAQCARLVFLCAQICDWFCLRPRFFPEVLAFLLGALQLCCESKLDEAAEVQFPSMNFPISHPHRQMLFIPSKETPTAHHNQQLTNGGAKYPSIFGNLSLPIEQIFHPKIDGTETTSAIFGTENGVTEEGTGGGANAEKCCRLRLCTVRALFATICQYACKYGTTAASVGDPSTDADGGPMRAAFNACFGPFHCLCLRLPVANYPAELADEASQLTQLLAKLMAQNGPVTQMKRTAKRGGGNNAIKMLEPRFDERFDPERHPKPRNNGMKTREKSWAKRAKNERRGALKELRKDAREMASAYAERQRKIRRERDEKTKRILQSLEAQESEHKKLKALKK